MTGGDPRDPATRKLAHDVANLLTAIIGATESILERCGLDPDTRADIEQIREGALRGAGLVRRPPAAPSPVEPVFINTTIRATSRLLTHCLGPSIALSLELPETDVQARIEPSRLDRILLNLLTNARHAMQGGGSVSLRTERVVLAAVHSGIPDSIPPGDYVAISVTDNGSGIAPHDLPRIFETGFSSRHDAGGSGLGLASVREIVRDAGGSIIVESEERRGTRFVLYFPACADTAPSRMTASPRADSIVTEGTAGMVLLVDDDPIILQVTERFLRRAGWAVHRAESARHALDVLDREACDLMISDVAMPGMDGLALTRLALTQHPDLPVILTSGYEPEPAHAGFGPARVMFLTKPYGRADLMAAVARMAER